MLTITYRLIGESTYYTTQNEKILDDKDKYIIAIEYMDDDGLYHRDDDGPAHTSFVVIKGISYIEKEDYFRHGVAHRIGKPAKICYYKNVITKEQYYVEGKLHRTDGPARIHYNEDGTMNCFCYFKNDNMHRDDGPAYQVMTRQGDIETQIYYNNGIIHRDSDEPAIIATDEESRILYWYTHGENLHNNPELPRKITYYNEREVHIFNNGTAKTIRSEDLLVKFTNL